MNMRASELGKFSHFYIQKLLFLSIFGWSFGSFVGTNDMIPNVPTKTLWAGGALATLVCASVQAK